MREILFRGKANTDGRDGEWVYGGLLPETENTFPIIVRDYDNDEDWIGVNGWDTVDPETVGQYTGLTDKNGKKIFEGDIGRYKQVDGAKKNGEPIMCTGKVIYWAETASFAVESTDEEGRRYFDYFPIKDFEVIGNIHDTHELLKGE